MDEEPIHLTTNEARGGTTPHIARDVLAVSLVLVVAAFAILGFSRGF